MGNRPGSRAVLSGQALALGPGSMSLYPLTRTLFVDSGTTTPAGQQDGQEWTPYDAVSGAMAAIAAAPVASTWEVVVRRSDGGAVSVPAGRHVVLRGAGWQEIAIGAVSWATSGAGTSSLTLRDLQAPSIAATGSATSCLLQLERCRVSGALTKAGGVSGFLATQDSASTRLCRAAGMTFAAGLVAPYGELQLGPLDIDDGPTEGALYRLSSTRQVQYADASGALDEAIAIAAYANLPEYILGVDGLEQLVLLEAGLTLSGEDLIYVSPTTPGRGTNVKPTTPGHYVLVVGIVLDASGYSGAEALVPVLWRRGELGRVGEASGQQLLGRLSAGSNWFDTDAIGLGTSNNSQALDDAGAWTSDAVGALSFFALRLGAAVGVATFEVYVKPFATGVWGATGIVLSLGALDVLAEEDATPLPVARFDQVTLVNTSGGAIFPGATVFSALFT